MSPDNDTNQSDSATDQHDLSWLAFCYIADELDDAAKESFEQRLDVDHAAREAVVEAMQQSRLINAALANPAIELRRPKRSRSLLRSPIVLACAAAGLLAAAFLAVPGQVKCPAPSTSVASANVGGVSQSELAMLADAWPDEDVETTLVSYQPEFNLATESVFIDSSLESESWLSPNDIAVGGEDE
jgi:ferric-dicitrate binding protein FerR (iron transport regulator)